MKKGGMSANKVCIVLTYSCFQWGLIYYVCGTYMYIVHVVRKLHHSGGLGQLMGEVHKRMWAKLPDQQEESSFNWLIETVTTCCNSDTAVVFHQENSL